jgi:hypothetical protein
LVLEVTVVPEVLQHLQVVTAATQHLIRVLIPPVAAVVHQPATQAVQLLLELPALA